MPPPPDKPLSGAETLPPAELRAIQSERLRAVVRHAYDNVPFYRARMDEAGVRPDDIRDIADVAKLPFTVKKDFRDQYPFGMLGTPMRDIVRIHASSGTTGKPTVAASTRGDLDVWAECAARALERAGSTPESIVHLNI